jgi:FixJ family two-component response regulator
MFDTAHEHSGVQYGPVRVIRSIEPSPTPTVFVLDGDASARRLVENLIRSAGWNVVMFASAAEFRAWPRPLGPSCVLLDVDLPDSSGLEVQESLNRHEEAVSTILTMERPNIPVTVRAMKAGAVEVLHKPIDRRGLFEAIDEALHRSREYLEAQSNLAQLRRDHDSLSGREREVMTLIVSGLLNKQVGGELGISEFTVKAHRGQVMRKMKARSFAQLVSMAAHLSTRPSEDANVRFGVA